MSDYQYLIRLPEDLADALKEMAKENDRSINSEMLQAIRKHVAERIALNQVKENE